MSYQVKNAIIMAAGFASRFAPLSSERPKGLLSVRGEVMIERQIRQLQEAGIEDITVVVGYMKEQFFYLEDKCHVKIVVNEDYYCYNNPASLMCVIDRLSNTYVCSSDNYFSENVFEPVVDRAYYAGIRGSSKTPEYYVHAAEDGRITRVEIGTGLELPYMIGHVFFSEDFCRQFIPLFRETYDFSPQMRSHLWEDMLIEHLDTCEIYLREYKPDQIYEFDSLEELRSFDSAYINNADSDILDNISSVLLCQKQDITDFIAINEGITNTSFRFSCKGREYVYRHPGAGTEAYIHRDSEAFSMRMAQEMGLDESFVFMDPVKGWKISYYVSDARHPDFNDPGDVRLALSLMRRLHNAHLVSRYSFDHMEEIDRLVHAISQKGAAGFSDFQALYDRIRSLYELTRQDGIQKQFCHCDCYRDNFLISPEGKGYLIDWEYSGNSDPSADIGTFISCSEYTYEEALDVIRAYYEDPDRTEKEMRHDLAYVAITSFYWFVWAIYQTRREKVIGSSLYRWYRNVKIYTERAIGLYRNTPVSIAKNS